MQLVLPVLIGALLCYGQSQAQVFSEAAAALTNGHYAAAERGFLTVLAASPDHVDSLLNLGVVYARTGRLEEAVTVYLRAGQLQPGSPRVLQNLAMAYLRQEAYSQALAVIRRLMEADRQNPIARDPRLLHHLLSGYLRERPAEETMPAVQALLAELPAATTSLIRCKLYAEQERFEEGAAECRQALRLDPQLPGAHLALARILVEQSDPTASEQLAAAIRENPSDAETLYDLGVALLQEDRAAEAAVYLERSTQMDPRLWAGFFQLGSARLRLDQPAAAVPPLRKATELKPDSFSAYYLLGRALIDAGMVEEGRRVMDQVRTLTAHGEAQAIPGRKK
jgi:tetratricopeptide (TPR) repeat protein